MRIDPTTPEGAAFIAEHHPDPGDPEITVEIVLHDSAWRCQCCREHFSDREDGTDEGFDVWLCEECAEDADPADWWAEHSTYHAVNGSVVG